MDTPKKLPILETLDQLRKFLQEETYHGPNGLLRHKCPDRFNRFGESGRLIAYYRAYFSIHDSRWGHQCAGSGQDIELPVPYCPSCEGSPKPFGCVHSEPSPIFSFEWIAIIEATVRKPDAQITDARSD